MSFSSAVLLLKLCPLLRKDMTKDVPPILYIGGIVAIQSSKMEATIIGSNTYDTNNSYRTFQIKARFDTEVELVYFRHGVSNQDMYLLLLVSKSTFS